jgi:hypothetical protein
VNSLPAELLVHIFKLLDPCNLDVSKGDVRSSLRPLAYPGVLSEVCSRWRNLVVVEAALWTHFDLLMDNGTIYHRFDLQQQHARNAPIHWHIVDQPRERIAERELLFIYRVMVVHYSRTACLELVTSTEPVLSLVLSTWAESCVPAGSIVPFPYNGWKFGPFLGKQAGWNLLKPTRGMPNISLTDFAEQHLDNVR